MEQNLLDHEEEVDKLADSSVSWVLTIEAFLSNVIQKSSNPRTNQNIN